MGFPKADSRAPAATLAAWRAANFRFCTASRSAQLRTPPLPSAPPADQPGKPPAGQQWGQQHAVQRHSHYGTARFRPAPPTPGPRWPLSPAAGGPPTGQALEGDLHARGSRCPRRDGRKLLQNDQHQPHNPNPPSRGPACPLKGTGGGGRVMGRAQTTRAAIARRERLWWALISGRAPAEPWYGSCGTAISSMRWQPAHDV